MTVEVRDLVKGYGAQFKLDIPHLLLETGGTFGLVGNNGAGKTTFLRLVLDLIRADRGQVLLDGKDVARDEAWKDTTGSYLDPSFVFDFLTVAEYFQFVGMVYGLTNAQLRETVERYRLFFGDQDVDEPGKFIRDLSLGNVKKVGLVGAMLAGPRLLILDEPFANLDPGSQIRLVRYLNALNASHGTTMIISSHDLGHVTEVCRSIAVLDRGRIARQIETSERTLSELKTYFSEQAERT